MTVGQLIERLSAYPADMPVLVDGVDVGYDDARLESWHVRKLDYDPGVVGRYEWTESDDPAGTNVLVLERAR